jgi:small-conductance mechanosensitive channel
LERESQLIRPAGAGFAYAILTFAVGFALGTVRVLLVVPRMGPTVAVLLEVPVILAASWWISRLCVARFKVSRAVAARLVMGLVAFLVLMLAEVTLSALLFGRSVTGYLASLTTLAGAIGLAAQLAFAGFPLIQATLARAPAADR